MKTPGGFDADTLGLMEHRFSSPKQNRIETTKARMQMLDNLSDDEEKDKKKKKEKMKSTPTPPVRPKSSYKETPSNSSFSRQSSSASQSSSLKRSLSKEKVFLKAASPKNSDLSASQPAKTLQKSPSTLASALTLATMSKTPTSKSKSAFDYEKIPSPLKPASKYVSPPKKEEKVRPPLPMPVLVPPPQAVAPPRVETKPKTPPKPSSPVNIPFATSNKPNSRSSLVWSTEPFYAEQEPVSPRPRVLLGLTGSVATIKINEMLRLITKTADVIVIVTKSAQHFATSETFEDVRFYNDDSEYAMWKERNDPVLHIELRKWADIFVVAPLSANSLAKLANGLCDNLVTCVARAWDFERPFYVAPAMNTLMWTHPFTEKHLNAIEEIGIKIIPPVQKTLMCGDKGTLLPSRSS